jgi:hypothetical protein
MKPAPVSFRSWRCHVESPGSLKNPITLYIHHKENTTIALRLYHHYVPPIEKVHQMVVIGSELPGCLARMKWHRAGYSSFKLAL